MVKFNFVRREVNVKLVYYGPGLSGKTTSLEVIQQKIPPENCGKLTSISTEQDRTLFFDFLPLDLAPVTVGGLKLKVRLFTVPGQTFYNATRKLVLQGADGVVFVADSQVKKLDENIDSLQNLKENLEEYDEDIRDIPLVMQWNKRDLPDILPVEELEKHLNLYNSPSFESIAVTGEGIYSGLKELCTLVVTRVRAKMEESIKNDATPIIESSTTEDKLASTTEEMAAQDKSTSETGDTQDKTEQKSRPILFKKIPHTKRFKKQDSIINESSFAFSKNTHDEESSSVSTDTNDKESPITKETSDSVSVTKGTSDKDASDSVAKETGDSVSQETSDEEISDSVPQETSDSVPQETSDKETSDSVPQETSDKETSDSVSVAKNDYVHLLKKGKLYRTQKIELLDLSGETFDNEVVLENLVIGELRAHETKFLKDVVLRNVTIDKIAMGGVYRTEEIDSTAYDASETQITESTQHKQKPAHFAQKLIVDSVNIHECAHFDGVEFGDDVEWKYVKMPTPQETQDVFVAMRYAKFTKRFSMVGCRFEAVDMREAQFRERVHISGTTFAGLVDFSRALGNAGAKFMEEFTIRECNFLQCVRWQGIDSYMKFSILASGFQENVFLSEARFHDEIVILDCKFHGQVTFHLSNFTRDVHLAKNAFSEVVCEEIHCDSKLYLQGSTMQSLQMDNCRCEKECNFANLDCGSLSLKSSIFNGVVNFSLSKFNGRCDLSAALFAQKADFRGVKFGDCIAMNHLDADKLLISWQQVDGKLESENKRQYAQAAEEYSILKTIFAVRNQYDDLDEVYYRYRQMQRKKLRISPLHPLQTLQRFAEFCALDRCCGYGTKPFRIAFASIIAVLVFACCYSLFPNQFVYIGPTSTPVLFDWTSSIYFSMATFTTMGFGDWVLQPYSFFRFVVAIEAFVGIFAMVLFVAAFTRKVIRS
ncbi:ion channel [Candidatus Uabimicrobium amorphum]|uniref:Cell polarity determinant GTPase MglA n=1 Tax=Uabimicrobium amorphum TaxID=2596890 RepID=A0A5S9IPJ6_UABAM|nr:ion channel [Candidatus Uabimicrobium amorphum]BBM84325.1 cell polarity determinant GTPase MglA [Candidatus Uabimicrobium amorphum]